MKKFALHKIAIIVAAIAVGSAGIATDALARGGGGGHFGGAMGGGHFGGIGGEHFGGEHQHFGEHRGWRAPYEYYGGCSADLGSSEWDLNRRSRIDAYTSEC
jgi:hypothetical protein